MSGGASPPLTDSQRRAVEAGDRDLWLTAGAGSGKTRVLTERYLHLHIARAVPVQRILAVTFTEKAAAEMRERIAGRLRREGRSDALHELPHAPIGTIDSFCFRLVREYADRVPVDPSLRVLEPVEAEEWEEEEWIALLDEWWSHRREDLLILLRAFPWTVGERFPGGVDPAPIRSLLRQIRTAGKDPADVSFEPCGGELLDERWRAVEPLVEEARALLEGKLPEKTAEKVRALLPLGGAAARPAEERFSLASEVRSSVTRQVSKDAKDVMNRAIALLGEIGLVREELAVAGARSLLGELVRRFHERFGARKERAGCADFLDVEEYALRLLRSEPVRREVRRRYRYLLLDECQDTNELQLEIVRRVRNDGCFLAVGDAKQSIYRFRDADVTAFVDMGDDYRGESSRERLEENFRSRRPILRWVNRFFPAVWGGNDGMRVPYEALEPARDDFPAKEEPSVEFLRVAGEHADAAREEEAALLAARLRRIHDDAVDGLGFGDMAILFRSTTGMPIFERALRRRGIPVVVAAGRGFFQAREVSDLLIGLGLVDDPRGDLRLAAALRSPLGNLSDPDLAHLLIDSPEEERIALWDRLADPSRLARCSAEGRRRLERFTDLFRRLRSLRGLLPACRLLEIATEETGYLDAMLLLPDGGRRRANCRKLIELAREREGRGDLSLAEAVRTLGRYRRSRLREPETAVDEERRAVRLMTVHGAKGMEFPLVAVADVGRRTPGERPLFRYRRGEGVGVRSRSGDTLLYSRIVEMDKRESEAEETRLLYVAATRAQRHLVFSGSRAGGASAWLKMLEEAGVPFDSPGMGEHLGVPVFVSDASGGSGEEVPPAPAFEAVMAAPGDYAGGADGDDVERVFRRLAWSPPPAGPSPAGRTVTEAHRFALCKKQYLYSRTVPVPPSAKTDAGPAGEADDRGGADLGSLFHRAMERAVRARTSGLPAPPAPEGEAGRWRDAVLNHPEFRSLTEGGELFTELSFAAEVGGGLLRGAIDLLVRRGDRWHVLDYKTDRGEPGRIGERYADSLALYRLAVRAVAGGEADVAASVIAVREGIVLPVPDDADPVALDLLARFDAAAAAGAYPATPSQACRFCDWRAICPDRDRSAESPPRAPGRSG